MLTDWLIYLDLLEENNFNTSFLRLATPVIFGIFQCNLHFIQENPNLCNCWIETRKTSLINCNHEICEYKSVNSIQNTIYINPYNAEH